MSVMQLAEVTRAMMVELMCPDCPFRACLIWMAEHYKVTGHGRR